jgi:transaldolase
MTKLHDLYYEQGQSPWLDNVRRGWITSGVLARWVEHGVRGITSNPTIFQKAIEGSEEYDEQFGELTRRGTSVDDAYWAMVTDDIENALRILRPVHDESGGQDGFVSVEVAPDLARDRDGTIASARELHARIDEPNLFVKVPATPEGIPAIEALIAEGRSINITLIFSLARYAEVINAYLSGLEAFTDAGGDPSTVHSVASFFVSRVDTEVDRRLEAVGGREALGLRGHAAIAQAKLAYRLFRARFSGPRWDHLAGQGAHRQRPLWASTSTKDPAYPDTLYVDGLIGPETVNTLPQATIAAFEDHGRPARSIDTDVDEADETMRRLAALGIDMGDVGRTLEDRGVASFHTSFQEVLGTLRTKAGHRLAR